METVATGYVRTFYVPEMPALLNVPSQLRYNDVVDVRQSAVLEERERAADGGVHAVKKKSLSGGRLLIEYLRDGDRVPNGVRVAVFLDHNCTRAFLAKLEESVPESLTVVLPMRRWNLSTR